MKIRPLGEKILVKRVEAETQTKSGIYLPESAKEKPITGTVIAVGPGKLSDEALASLPDPEIVSQVEFATLEHRLRELAFLNAGVEIIYEDERVGNIITLRKPR